MASTFLRVPVALKQCTSPLLRAKPLHPFRHSFKPRSTSLGRCASTWCSNDNLPLFGSSVISPNAFHSSKAYSRPLYTSSTLFAGDVIEVEGPAFAESISEGDIRWIKKPGDFVKADEVVAQIETDKTTVDVPCPKSGVIESLIVQDGDKVTAKQKIFKLKLQDAPAGGGRQPEPPKPSAEAPKKTPSVEQEKPKQEPKKADKPSSPPPQAKSDKQAGTGPIPSQMPTVPQVPQKPMSSMPASDFKPTPQGSVSPQVGPSVQPSGAEKAITGARSETRVKMNRMRQRIAARLKDAQNMYAMLTTFQEIDMSGVVGMRKKYQDGFAKKHGVKLGFMSPFVKAAAYALIDQPVVNAVIDESEIIYRHYIDISVAVATPKGLVVPVLRNVEGMNYAQIERSLVELGEKARDNKLAIEDMEGGTFTISNGGVFGSLYGTPIINPPQSAILGMHAIVDRPVAIAGKVEIRPMMVVALTYDHRLIDGREAVTFLKKIKAAVEDPTTILLEL